MSKVITVASPFWDRSISLGRLALEIANGLEADGWTVNTIGNDPPRRTYVPTLLNVLVGHPTSYHHYGALVNAGVKIPVVMWESTILPPEWASILNTCSHLVVPCRWNADVFANNGVTVPISVCPLGISKAFTYKARPARDVFRFVAFADRKSRKGTAQAMFAFVRAFGNREDVELVMKAHLSALGEFTNRNIHMIDDSYSDDQLNAFYHDADCMAFPACGEGFGLPPREFAATGGISIATNYGGLADDIDEWGIPLGYELTDAWVNDDKFEGLGQWASPDIDQLSALMRRVLDMPLDERNRMGKQNSENVRSRYQWQGLVNHIEGVIDEVTRGTQRRSA